MLPRATVRALVAVAMYCLFLLACKTAPVTPTVNGDIGLKARQSGDTLAVTWNRLNPALGSSTGGSLLIEDGADKRRIDLSVDQLRIGSVNYLPQTHTVRFRLEIYRDKQHFDGEDLTVATGVPEPVSQRPHQPTPSHQAQHEAQHEAQRQVQREAHRQVIAIPRSKAPVSLAPRPSVAPPYVAARPKVAMPSLPTAPSMPEPRPKLPEPPPSTAPVHVPPPTISYVGPAPIRKIAPAVPDNLRFLIKDGVSVGVKVEIDAEGKVTGATPVETSNSVQKVLGSAAAQAALLWRFEPARRNGRVVASETILEFDFERGTR